MNRERRHPAGEFPGMQYAGKMPALPGVALQFWGAMRAFLRENLSPIEAERKSDGAVNTTTSGDLPSMVSSVSFGESQLDHLCHFLIRLRLAAAACYGF